MAIKTRELYDIITKEIIKIPYRKEGQIAKKLGFSVSCFSKFWKRDKQLHIGCRYILPEDKDKLFTLVELDSQKEYECITFGTLFVHFNIPKNKKRESMSGLFNKTCGYRTILGKIFYLKQYGKPIFKKIYTKTKSKYLQEIQKERNYKRYLSRKLRMLIHLWLIVRHSKKLNHTKELIGCTLKFLIEYIEKQFTKGMTWKNQGEWHIDHIIPCNRFDLNKPEEQCKCFHYSNLRPLWATTKIAIKHGENENYVGNQNRKLDGSN
ncbi:MAG: hypothetical protein Q7R95_10715 [bacterium]|nr:hypothetical protein [bacterium]